MRTIILPRQARDERRENSKKGRFLQGWPLHNSGAISPKDDPHVAVIAAKRQRTPTQVLLRWALQHGAAVIPTSRTHSADNAAVFDFALSDEEMATISGLSWFMEGEGNTPQFADVLGVKAAMEV